MIAPIFFQVELKFKVGDVIYVYGDMDEDGFFTVSGLRTDVKDTVLSTDRNHSVFILCFRSLQGELRGIRGLVPSNFLEDLSDPPEATHQYPSHDDSYVSEVCCLNSSYHDCHRSGNGQGKQKFFKVREKSGNFILGQGKLEF